MIATSGRMTDAGRRILILLTATLLIWGLLTGAPRAA